MGGEEDVLLGTGLQVTFGAWKREKNKKEKGWRRWEGKLSQVLCSPAFGEGQGPYGVRKALSKGLGDGGPADEEGTAWV